MSESGIASDPELENTDIRDDPVRKLTERPAVEFEHGFEAAPDLSCHVDYEGQSVYRIRNFDGSGRESNYSIDVPKNFRAQSIPGLLQTHDDEAGADVTVWLRNREREAMEEKFNAPMVPVQCSEFVPHGCPTATRMYNRMARCITG